MTPTLTGMTMERRDFHPRLWAIRVTALVQSSGVNAGSKTLVLAAPPIACEAGRWRRSKNLNGGGSSEDSRGRGIRMRVVSPLSENCRT